MIFIQSTRRTTLDTGAPGGRPAPGRRRGRAVSIAAALGLVATALVMPGAQAVTGKALAQTADPSPITIRNGPNFTHLPAPLSTSQCLSRYRIRCYTPAQLHRAYNLDPLYRKGIDGRGMTIVIPVPFGSPTVRHDLEVFDRQFNLPDPELEIIRFGDIPPYDPTDSTRVEWAAGTSLVVQNAHAIAPGAKIVIAETAVSETEGVTGFPELFQAVDSLMDAGVGDVIAQIEITGERTFPGFDEGDYASLLALRGTYQRAAAEHVTVLAATSSYGKAANWPSTDPLVTAVGGNQVYLDEQGRPLSPVTTWNDGYGAGGGGLSTVFARPFYQSGVADVLGSQRGAPDITMAGAVDGGGWIYTSFGGTGGIGWNIFNGTAQAMSLFAGIVALADQVADHRLGLINPELYRLGELARRGNPRTGLIDITRGDTTFGTKIGYRAVPGYDLATGWGTLDAATFVPALAHLHVPPAAASRPPKDRARKGEASKVKPRR
ncbi:MAG: S53 family peptidase [Jatrophihabitantaceae bacterium]